ncbi:hypothetical protein DFH06DRAFT_1479139 [Mycena polygramma]|nr:hypothetical protein DFH06DRAFT_1479139 [Mycena polygramma]
MIHDLSPSQHDACAQYAGDVYRWIAKKVGHPGEPPVGYESYRKINHLARVPEDFPEVLTAWNTHKNAQLVPGVNMPGYAFSDIVNMPERLINTVIAGLNGRAPLAQTHPSIMAPRNFAPRVHGHMVKPRFQGNKGQRGPLARRMGQRRDGKGGVDAKGKGNAKGRRDRKGKGRRVNTRRGQKARVDVAMVSVQGTSAVAAEAAAGEGSGCVDVIDLVSRDVTPMPIVEEDVHMDEWLVRREDEDDDGMGGSVLGWDGGEPVSVM